MSDRCKQCGAALTERDAFCTKCGARRGDTPEPDTRQRFCTRCGAALSGETKFCTKCGAAAEISSSSAAENARDFLKEAMAGASSSATVKTTPQATPSPAPVAKSAAGIPKVAILGGALVVVVLVLVVGIAGFIHAAHRARERAQEQEGAENIEKSLKNLAADSKGSQAKGTASPSSDADLQKNLAEMQAAANALGAKSDNAGANSAPSNSGTANTNPAAPAKPSAPYGWTLENGKLVPAKGPEALPMPKADPIEPVAATGNQVHDWALKYERTLGGPEADLVVRTGDINNLGFGWPKGFDPFSGQSTPPHQWPDIEKIPSGAPDGTDRIMLGTSVMPVHMVTQHVAGQPDQITLESITHTDGGDGYSGALGDCYYIRDGALQKMPQVLRDPVSRELTEKFVLSNLPDGIRKLAPSTLQGQLPLYFKVDAPSAARCTRERALTMPAPIVLPVGSFRFELQNVVVQIFVDDFQPLPLHSHFQVSLNGTRVPNFEYAINSLDQSGPIGKLLTLKLLPEYFPLIESGTVKLLIDDPTTRVQDGYAVDFVRILLNPYKFKYQVSLAARVLDADKNTPISGATVTAALESAATDRDGKCELKGLPAGLVVATASAPGYDETSVPVDLPAGQAGNAEIRLHRHQEGTAALEQSIAQTGTATIYGIHFDTNSSKLRPDSLPALNAVLGLIKNHPDSHWIISGHTDNQGNAALNQPLSEARAKSVVTWLKQHGTNVSGLVPQGFGATRPVADNATANGRALNRRVEVSLQK
jgi:outer membrane protein OmpA-like peptidoglycan-associated protein